MTSLNVQSKLVVCSAGKGTMTVGECLDCARRTGLPPCGFEHTMLSAMYGAFTEDRSKEIHVTDLTKCIRKAFLDKTTIVPEMPHEKLAAFSGLAHHALLEAKADTAAEAEMVVSLDGVVGRVDSLNEDGVLIDYKTVKEIYRDRLPYGEHDLQLNIYAYMLRRMGKQVNGIRLVYISRAGPTTCKRFVEKRPCNTPVEWVNGRIQCPRCGNRPDNAHLGVVTVNVDMYPDNEIEEVFTLRSQLLRAALDTGALPPGETGWLCRYCPHECDVRGG